MAQSKKAGFQRVDALEIRLPGIAKVVMLGDPGCTSFSGDSKRVLDEILRQEADLFFLLGDLAFTDSIEELHEMIDFCNARVKVPIFATRGNHELSSYPELLGFSSYALVLDHHVCFFLCDATGHFPESDLDLLRNKLEMYQDKKFIVLMHIPPPADVSRKSLKREDWEKLKAVLDPHREKVQHIFCGHIHGFHQYEIDGYPVTVTAGGGAAMIHELLPPAQKLHHSIALSLYPNGSFSMEVVPAGAGVV